MSMHGVCFNNGMSGNCNIECSDYLKGECGASSEMIPSLFGDDLKYHYSIYPCDNLDKPIYIGIDFAEGADQQRMLYNDVTPVKFEPRPKVKPKYISKCHLCGKECNKVGKASYWLGGCK